MTSKPSRLSSDSTNVALLVACELWPLPGRTRDGPASRRHGCWWRDVGEGEVEAELCFLRENIYRRDLDVPTRRLTAFDRFSDRS